MFQLRISGRWDIVIRINVTGNAGAGKTALAAVLGEALELPVYSLDSIVWQSGWKKTPADPRAAAELELTTRPTWIIDGVSRSVRRSADLVLFLDVPRHVCTRRALMRSLRSLTSTRPGLPEGCPEWKIIPRLLKIIWQFPANAGMAIHRDVEMDPRRHRIIHDAREAMGVIRHWEG